MASREAKKGGGGGGASGGDAYNRSACSLKLAPCFEPLVVLYQREGGDMEFTNTGGRWGILKPDEA
jgi:hypothetical protein